ncbi:hypothetical protein D3C73_589220 [compost metagenome]
MDDFCLPHKRKNLIFGEIRVKKEQFCVDIAYQSRYSMFFFGVEDEKSLMPVYEKLNNWL